MMETCGWYTSKMSQKVKIGGVWKDGGPFVKISGAWKVPESIFNKVDGVWKQSFLQGGKIDSAFNTTIGTGANNAIYNAISGYSDSRIIIGGFFTDWNGTAVPRMARISSTGVLDTTFNTNIGTGPNGIVYDFAIYSDNRVIVGHSGTTFNGVANGRLARVSTTGVFDTAFNSNMGAGATTSVIRCLLQSDEKILIGLSTSAGTWNGISVGGFLRLNSDGTRDLAFSTNIGTGAESGGIQDVELQPDGKIIVATSATIWNGTTVNYIVRLNSDGTRDTAFTTNTGTAANGLIRTVKLQPDGKIILAGQFTSWNGTTVGRVVRLNSDGTRDTTFTTNTGTGATNLAIWTAEVQSGGKIVLGGTFTSWNGATVGEIVRLNSDGTRDVGFSTNVGTAGVAGSNSAIYKIFSQLDDKLIIGGDFITWNGTGSSRIVRIGGDFAG